MKTFAAKLTVTNQAGLSSTLGRAVTVGSVPPTPTITAPSDGTTVYPGQTITYKGSATDPEDGPLPASALKWTVLLHHNTHVHTFVGGTGSQGSFVAQDHGAIGTFSYEIILTATDSSGLKKSTSVNVPVGRDTSPPTAPPALTATAAGSGPDQPELDGVDRQRRRDRLPGRALPGRRLHELRRDRGADAATSYSDTGGDGRRRPTGTGCAAADPSGNLSGYSTVATATTADAAAGAAGPGRRLGVRRGHRHHDGRRLRQRQRRHAHRRHLDDAGPLRQRAELQRRDSVVRVAQLAVAQPGRGDDAGGLDQADRDPERLADGHAAPDRRLLPQRQQRRRPAAPGGRRHLRRRHLSTSSARPRARSTPGRTWRSPTTAPRCGSTSTASQVGQPARRRARSRAHQPAVDRRQQPLRRVLPGPDRRGPRLQPRAHAGRDPEPT